MSRGREVGAGRSSNDPRQSRGRSGEELACHYLEEDGYSIVETNHRSRYGEIDIIASKENTLAFIEVKTRLGRSHGEPFEAVGARKQNQIRRMASMWVAANQGNPELRRCEFRFDVISVYLSERRSETGFSEEEEEEEKEEESIPGTKNSKFDSRREDPEESISRMESTPGTMESTPGMMKSTPGIIHMKDAFK